MHKCIELFVKLLYPPRCPVCDKVVPFWDTGICNDCFKVVRYVEPPRCMKCGKHIEDAGMEFCADCSEKGHVFKSGRALYQYREMAASIYRFKYGGRRDYASVFGKELAYYLGDYIKEIEPDALIPVPLFKKKERLRGYNQSVLLARALGAELNIKVVENLVFRIKNTKPLKLLNPEERLNNLKKAFILMENGVKLKRVIIVDDIYTTGSTINTIAELLLSRGIEEIYFVTLAIGENG